MPVHNEEQYLPYSLASLLQGMSRAQRGVHPLMVLGHSLVQLKPYVWVSYWYERKYRLFEKRKWGKEGY